MASTGVTSAAVTANSAAEAARQTNWIVRYERGAGGSSDQIGAEISAAASRAARRSECWKAAVLNRLEGFDLGAATRIGTEVPADRKPARAALGAIRGCRPEERHCRRFEAQRRRGLTFEVTGRRRQDARPGLVKCTVYHQPGPGGLPLALRLTEVLGHAARTLGGEYRCDQCSSGRQQRRRGGAPHKLDRALRTC